MFDSFGFKSFFGNSFVHDIVTHSIQARDAERFTEVCEENRRFLSNVPHSIAPCGSTNYEGRTLNFGNNSAIYDDDGEMVWNSVTGLCGKAVCI